MHLFSFPKRAQTMFLFTITNSANGCNRLSVTDALRTVHTASTTIIIFITVRLNFHFFRSFSRCGEASICCKRSTGWTLAPCYRKPFAHLRHTRSVSLLTTGGGSPFNFCSATHEACPSPFDHSKHHYDKSSMFTAIVAS
jgi:hypothetical protein